MSRALSQAYSIAVLRSLAARRLPRAIFDFIDGGAGDELTLNRNVDELRSVELVPRCLRDVSIRDLGAGVLGKEAALPLIVAPTGLAALAWPHADLLIARACAASGIPFIVSTSSSERLEDIATAASDSRLWFQMYLYRDRTLVELLIRRAQESGYEALVVTVDTPFLGHRLRDYRNGFTVPLRPSARLIWDCIRSLRWSCGIVRHGVPRMINITQSGSRASVSSLAELMASNLNPGSTWTDIDWVRKLWKGKLVIKGILSVLDAECAVSHGVDGLYISNHGGRQLDGAPATISVLSELAQKVGGRIDVFMDGGVRNGCDIAKVIALGGTAAAIGRPILYGVAVAGELGVQRAIHLFKQEYDQCLGLLGCASGRSLDASYVRRRSSC